MREKRIPTLFGLLIMSLLVFGVALAIPQAQNLLTRASPDLTPKNILVSNIDFDSFTVSWTTASETTGFVKVDGKVFMDTRDLKKQQTGKYISHLVLVSGLKAETQYRFGIGSGTTVYYSKGDKINSSCEDFLEADISGEGFMVKTAPETGTPSSDMISGLVLTSDQKAANGAIICLQLDGYYPLTTIVGESSEEVNFFINLGMARKIPDYSRGDYQNLGLMEDFVIIDGKEPLTRGICETGKDKPMSPAIVLGVSGYKCSETAVGALKGATPGQGSLFLTPTPGDNSQTSTSIDSPELSGSVNDTLPTFKGKGQPGQVIQIVVESDQLLSGSVRIKADGTWSWTPPENLEPGEHTVTLTLIDENGNRQTITRKFTVIGTNPLLPITNGTPSANTVTPTIIPPISATPRITNTPTVTPTPYNLRPGGDDPGNETPLILFLFAGSLFIASGLLLYFWAKPSKLPS